MPLDFKKDMHLSPVDSSLSNILLDANLSKIDLANKELGSEGIYDLYIILQNRKQLHQVSTPITSINLRNTKLTTNELSTIEEILSQETHCWVLDISENNFGNKGLEKIFAMLIKTQIKILNLRKISACNLNAQALSELIQQNTNLYSFDISSNEFPSEQIEKLQLSITQLQKRVEMFFSVNISEMKDLKRANPTQKNKRDNEMNGIDILWKRNRVGKNENENGLAAKKEFKNNEIDASIIKCRNLVFEHQEEIISLIGKSFEEQFRDINNNEPINRRTDCRSFNEPLKVRSTEIFLDNRFPVHPIVQLSSNSFLCEAPAPKNDLALSNFCQELTGYELCQLKNLIVIGDPNQGKQYYDYFSREQHSVFSYTLKTAFREHKSRRISLRELSIETKKDGVIKKKVLNLYHIRGRLKDDYLCLEDDDKKVLYELALTLEPKTIMSHCDIGCLSAMLLFSFHLFRNFTDIFVGKNTKITKRILQILTEWRSRNSGILPTEEFAKKAVKLAFEYIDLHCKALIDGNVLKRIHNFAGVKTIAILGNANTSSLCFTHIAAKLHDLGINVYIINLSPKESKIANHYNNFKQVLEIKNENFIEETILTNLVAVSARRILARLVASGEVDVLLAIDKDMSKGLIPAVLKDQKIPRIYLIENDTDEKDVRELISEGTMVVSSKKTSNENNNIENVNKWDSAISAASGLLKNKNPTINITSSQKSQNNIIFWSPLQCYKLEFIKQCEEDFTRTGYQFHKFVSTDKNANKEFEYLSQDEAIHCIIEMPNIELVNETIGICKYISKPLKHTISYRYIMIIAGCDSFESKQNFAKRGISKKSDFFQYKTTLEENREIGKSIADRIMQLAKAGNKVDVLIPARPHEFQEGEDWDAMIKPIQQSIDSKMIHYTSYSIDEPEFYLVVVDLACIRKVKITIGDGNFLTANHTVMSSLDTTLSANNFGSTY